MQDYEVTVKEKVLQQDMFYKNHIIMNYTIKYPHFVSEKFQTLLDKINSIYRTKALMYEKTNVMNLYQMAMVEYEYLVANNHPVRQFEAYVDYDVTYNQNCTISLFFDQYEYAGGAHGLTLRNSDTWNLQRSKKIDLSDLYPGRPNYKDIVIQLILQQIEKDLASERKFYFEDYKELVPKNMKSSNFYLTKEGVVIYFQQYDIAPYAGGISTFTIPYSAQGPVQPKCILDDLSE